MFRSAVTEKKLTMFMTCPQPTPGSYDLADEPPPNRPGLFVRRSHLHPSGSALDPEEDPARHFVSIPSRDLPEINTRAALDPSGKPTRVAMYGRHERMASIQQLLQRRDEAAREALHLSDFVDQIEIGCILSLQHFADHLVDCSYIHTVPAHAVRGLDVDVRQHAGVAPQGSELEADAASIHADLIRDEPLDSEAAHRTGHAANDRRLAHARHAGKQQRARAVLRR